jgi:outer membrane protein assembly factor BamB
VNKILIIIFIFIVNCSLDKKSGLWTKTQKVEKQKIIINEAKTKDLFTEDLATEKELNPNLKIRVLSKPRNEVFKNNFNNNIGFVNYDGNLKKISKFKYKKIKNFDFYELDIVFDNENIIFFDNKGSILKFNDNSKLIWKKNFYTKRQRKSQPILFFANNKDKLIVADNIAKYYALDINSGELLWSQRNTSSFNSQIKIYKDKFFIIDLENILRCYSLKDGKEIWKLKTEKSFIKSQKKLSLIVYDDKVYFSNSVGDISAVDIQSGSLIWQTPTQGNLIYEDAFFLKTSDLIANPDTILFSNNKNEFYSLNIQTGIVNWKQKINSNLRSTLIDDLIFSISMEGFLIITDLNTGNIIRTTDVFEGFIRNYLLRKGPQRTKQKPVGFIVGKKNIYLTTDRGRLLIIDILTGKTQSVIKIDKKEKISRPFALNQNLFIIKNDAIIKLN